MKIKSYFESFLEILYPEINTCLVCGEYDDEIGTNYICYSCNKNLSRLKDPLCNICSKPIDQNSSINICLECKKNKRYFETVKSLLHYDNQVQKIIHKYKYYDKAYYCKLFGSMLYNYIKENNYCEFDLITSIPLHKSKIKSRGYNQSELIAKYIAKKINILYSKCLKRINKTKVQNELSKHERRKNVKNAFIAIDTHIIKNKTVLIIDDIYTTGATINECSRVLIEEGAKNIYGLTIARG